MRLPLSVPWPEPADPFAELKAAHAAGRAIQILNPQNRYVDADPKWTSPVEYYRIKPEAPPFQLPPPPPGMQWHRTDGWKESDLPQGYRPLVQGEKIAVNTDEWKQVIGNPVWIKRTHTYRDEENTGVQPKQHAQHRTTRPLTFEHAGKTWTWHRPGDPMPCLPDTLVELVFADLMQATGSSVGYAQWWLLGPRAIIGWRYAEPQTKTVPLGPEDVRCGDEITIDEYDDVRRQVLAVESTHIHLSVYGRIDYETLRKRQAKIRRRDSDEFVPCSKEVAV